MVVFLWSGYDQTEFENISFGCGAQENSSWDGGRRLRDCRHSLYVLPLHKARQAGTFLAGIITRSAQILIRFPASNRAHQWR